jgi:hypothetical protein
MNSSNSSWKVFVNVFAMIECSKLENVIGIIKTDSVIPNPYPVMISETCELFYILQG